MIKTKTKMENGRGKIVRMAAFALLYFLSSILAPATQVYFPVQEMTGTTNDVVINVKPVNNPVIWNGTFYWLPRDGTNLTTVGGVVTNAFVPGTYTVAIPGLTKSWTMAVTNSAATLSAADLSVGITVYGTIQHLNGTGIQVTNDGRGTYTIVDTNSQAGGGSATAALTNHHTEEVTFESSLLVNDTLTAGATLNVNGGKAYFGPSFRNWIDTNGTFSLAGSNIIANTSGDMSLSNTITAAAFFGVGSGLTTLNANELLMGTVPPVRLGSGSGGAAKFLREDSTWQTSVGLAAYVSGTLTNSTTGNASTATTATNAWSTLGTSWHWSNQPPSEGVIASASRVPIKWWGTWNDYGASIFSYITNVSETNILLQCHWMKTNGLWDAGYRYISVQEGWQLGLNGDGTFAVTNRFPNGMKWLFNEIRRMGFLPGIYTGITADGPANTCMGYVGTAYTNLLTHMRQFKDWGAAFIFFDSCQGYSPWTQGPPGLAVASADELELYRERARIIQWAIEEAKFTNQPVVLLSAPHVYSTNTQASLFPDRTAAGFANIWPIAPTNNMDFLIGGFTDVAKYFITNCLPAARLTRPGFYQYGYITQPEMPWNVQQLAIAFDGILPASSTFSSGGNRINFWVNPTTYPMSSWDDYFPSPNPRKNLLVNAIQQDPAVLPGSMVYSNDSAVAIVRRLGSENGVSNALMLVNWKSSSQTIQVPHMWLGLPDSTPVTYREVFTNQIVVNGVISNQAMTVTSSNVLYLLAYPDVCEPNETTMFHLRGEDITGTGVAAITATTYGPANWYSRAGMSQSAANNAANFYLKIPTWASGVEVTAWMTTAGSGTIAWTNSPAYEMYRGGAREVFYDANTAGITNSIVLCTSFTLTEYKTGFALTPTNYPRMFNLGLGASTNANARYIIGPVKVKFYGAQK